MDSRQESLEPGRIMPFGSIPQDPKIIFRLRLRQAHEQYLLFTKFASGATGVQKNGNGWKALPYTIRMSSEKEMEIVAVLNEPLKSPWEKFLNSA